MESICFQHPNNFNETEQQTVRPVKNRTSLLWRFFLFVLFFGASCSKGISVHTEGSTPPMCGQPYLHIYRTVSAEIKCCALSTGGSKPTIKNFPQELWLSQFMTIQSCVCAKWPTLFLCRGCHLKSAFGLRPHQCVRVSVWMCVFMCVLHCNPVVKFGYSFTWLPFLLTEAFCWWEESHLITEDMRSGLCQTSLPLLPTQPPPQPRHVTCWI